MNTSWKSRQREDSTKVFADHRGNLRANGYPNSGRWRQFQCLSCKQYFLETYGTPLHGKRVVPEVLGWAVGTLTEGLGNG